MTSVAICCIALNEDLYIDEWLEYHFGLGFNHVYVYDNSDGGTLILKRKNVTVIHMPGPVKQVPAYNNFMENFAEFHDWCAFIDVDEFFVLHKHSSIKEYLEELSTVEAIGVNWLMFGSGGQERYEPRPVMERFVTPSHDHGANQHIKCIVKTRNLPINGWGVPVNPPEFQNCHFPQDTPIAVHVPGGRIRVVHNTPFNEKWDHSIIQLNHYFCKSREEFALKTQRGRADTTEKRTMAEFF